MNAWLCLVMAIGFEVAGTSSMKFSHGLSRLLPSLLVFTFYMMSVASLTVALRRIDVSVAYATWSGVGTVLVAVVGALCFNEPVLGMKIVCLSLIVGGVIGLHLLGAH